MHRSKTSTELPQLLILGCVVMPSSNCCTCVGSEPNPHFNCSMYNTKELMHCHCGTNNRAPRWTFTDPCKPEVRPGAREETETEYDILYLL